MQEMDGEFKNFIRVWGSAVLSLWYCHIIGKLVPKGVIRLFVILPIILFFFFLPLNLSTILLGGPTSFFIAWLANFKLLLFAFGQGPLSNDPPLSLPYFISVACLPIKLQQNPQKDKSREGQKSPLNYATKILVLVITSPIYRHRDHIHPKLVSILYCVYLYISLESILAAVAASARVYLGLELDPQFNEPYLTTSLQDFWGRRWNLMVTNILHPTVYKPVRSVFGRLIGRKWAAIPGVVASFFVSGIMHEIIFYYIGRKKPTWELTCYFLLHGICLSIEIVIKQAVNGRWRLPTAVSWLLSSAFVVVTTLWLFMPQALYAEFDVKARRECIAFADLVKDVATDLRYRSLFIISTKGH